MDDVKNPREDLQCEERPLRHAGVEESFRPDTSHPERMAGHDVQGALRRFTVRDALAISCFDLISPRPFNGTAKSDPTFVVTVLLEAHGRSLCTSSMSNAPLVFPFASETLVYTFTRAVTEGIYDVPPMRRMRGVEVRMSHDHLERLGGLDLFRNATTEHPFHVVSNIDVWLGTIPAPAEAKVCAERILNAAHSAPADDLAIEANGLAILNTGLAAMRIASSGDSAEVRQCRPQLETARQLLVDDPAHSWSISELAAAVSLTEKRLKSGFRSAFGTPVHAFLQGARMSKAKRLLEASEMSVTEVSLAVGYANPSHFAYLYRRTFGVTPSARAHVRRS